MIYGTVRLDDMVAWQGEQRVGHLRSARSRSSCSSRRSIAENKRVPFDAPEGESEIVAGYFLEYSGMKLGMFMFGEYMELATSSALLTTLFFGGYALPFLHRDGITVAFGETVLFHQQDDPLPVVICSAWSPSSRRRCSSAGSSSSSAGRCPRFRYDQIMKLGWRVLAAARIANMMVTGVVLLAIEQGGRGSPALAAPWQHYPRASCWSPASAP